MSNGLDIRRVKTSAGDMTDRLIDEFIQKEYEGGRGYFKKFGEDKGGFERYGQLEERDPEATKEQIEWNWYEPTSHQIRSELESKIGTLHTSKGDVESWTSGETFLDKASSFSNRGDKVDTSFVSGWSQLDKADRKTVASDMFSHEVPDDMKGKAKLDLRKKHGLHEYGTEYEAYKSLQIYLPNGKKAYLIENDMGDGEKVYQIRHPGTKGKFVETNKQAFNSALKTHMKRVNKISNITTEQLVENPGIISEKWYGKPEVTVGKIKSADNMAFEAVVSADKNYKMGQ